MTMMAYSGTQDCLLKQILSNSFTKLVRKLSGKPQNKTLVIRTYFSLADKHGIISINDILFFSCET